MALRDPMVQAADMLVTGVVMEVMEVMEAAAQQDMPVTEAQVLAFLRLTDQLARAEVAAEDQVV